MRTKIDSPYTASAQVAVSCLLKQASSFRFSSQKTVLLKKREEVKSPEGLDSPLLMSALFSRS